MITNYSPVSRQIDEAYNAITSDNVKTVLFARIMILKRVNPLEDLTLVDQHISEVMFPECSYARKLALQEIVIDIITSELIRHRRIMELPFTPGDCSISEAFRAIVGDGKTSNAYLIGWSWLYYHFVRIELGLSQQEYCGLVHLDDRTIRRYQEIACRQITEILIYKEWNARQSRLLTQVTLKGEFTEVEMNVTLKLHTILEMIRVDKSLFHEFVELLEVSKNREVDAIIGST